VRPSPSLSACSRVVASSPVRPSPPRHPSNLVRHLSFFCHCHSNLQLLLSPLLPYATSNSANVQPSPEPTSPPSRPHPPPDTAFGLIAWHSTILRGKTRPWVRKSALLCLFRHTHPPLACCFCSRRPWLSQSHHSTPVCSSYHQHDQRFFTVQLVCPIPHLFVALPLHPQSVGPSLAVRTLLCPAVPVVRFFYSSIGPGIVAQKPTALAAAQTRLSAHSAVPCGSIGTFFSLGRPPSPSRLAHSLAGSHLPMELAK
jgi:hypothetical protein